MSREMFSCRMDDPTLAALKKKAKELGTSESNAIGVMLGTIKPKAESAYPRGDKRGKLITR